MVHIDHYIIGIP